MVKKEMLNDSEGQDVRGATRSLCVPESCGIHMFAFTLLCPSLHLGEKRIS